MDLKKLGFRMFKFNLDEESCNDVLFRGKAEGFRINVLPPSSC